MNIGILGWWRASNQGDFAIRRNLEKALAPHRVVPIDMPFELTRDELDRLNLLDFLILGGGGLFQNAPPLPFDTFDQWGPRLKTPIGVVGVGIDTVAPRYRAPVDALVEKARFFYVRDQESRILVQHPKVQVMPDLSFLYPFPQASIESTLHSPPVCGVNLRTLPCLDLDPWLTALRRLPVHLRGIPFSTYSILRETETLRRLDADCPPAFNPSLYEGLDLMLGMAFHSVLFGIQASIPTIAIASTPKVRRLYEDLGLEEWMLGTDDWDRVPELVRRALERREQLSDILQKIAIRLTQEARKAFSVARSEIEGAVKPRSESRARASIIVIGSASDADNQLTMASCLTQTHDNLEILFVGDGARVPSLPASPSPTQVRAVPAGPSEALTKRLNRALAEAAGDYVSWISAGDYYAHDAISCMLAHLEENVDCDMVFADYYTLHAVDYVADARSVHSARKLFRGNVVGPCFLFRRDLTQCIGSLRDDTPYTAYDYWLRAGESGNLRPLHARLFFTQVSDGALRDRALERQTRRRWRSNRSWPIRTFWHAADTEFVDRRLLRPTMAILRRFDELFRPGDSIRTSR